MSRIVRLTESDLTRIVRRVISEQTQIPAGSVIQGATAASGGSTTGFRIHGRNQQFYYQCYNEPGSVAGKIYDAGNNEVDGYDMGLKPTDYEYLNKYCKL